MSSSLFSLQLYKSAVRCRAMIFKGESLLCSKVEKSLISIIGDLFDNVKPEAYNILLLQQ